MFRTRLRSLARDSEGNYSDEPPIIYSDMSSVADHWKDFVAHASTLEFKVTFSLLNYFQLKDITI